MKSLIINKKLITRKWSINKFIHPLLMDQIILIGLLLLVVMSRINKCIINLRLFIILPRNTILKSTMSLYQERLIQKSVMSPLRTNSTSKHSFSICILSSITTGNTRLSTTRLSSILSKSKRILRRLLKGK